MMHAGMGVEKIDHRFYRNDPRIFYLKHCRPMASNVDENLPTAYKIVRDSFAYPDNAIPFFRHALPAPLLDSIDLSRIAYSGPAGFSPDSFVISVALCEMRRGENFTRRHKGTKVIGGRPAGLSLHFFVISVALCENEKRRSA